MQADSVAVNQPNSLPPTMMSGVISAGTETASDAKQHHPGGARIGRIAASDRIGMDGRHLRGGDQDPGNDAGQEERADRDGEDAAPDDHQDGGRDDDGEHRRDGRDRDGEGVVVAFLALRLDEDLRLARRVGGRGARNPGEEERQHHVDLRQPAGKMPDHRPRQCQQPVGDAADIHQVRRQQEERHGEQDEGVEGVERLLHERHGGEARLQHQHRQAGERQREGHGHAQEHQPEEQAEQDQRRLGGREQRARHGRCSRSGKLWQAWIGGSAVRPVRTFHSSHICSPRKISQVAPVIGQAMWISQSGSSASSEMRYQALRVNSMPDHTNTSATTRMPSRATILSGRLGAPRQARPDVDLEMRAFAHADHGADHHRPDEEEARHLLRPDVAGDELREAREDLQRDRDDQDRGRGDEQPGQERGVGGGQLAPAAAPRGNLWRHRRPPSR